MTFPVSEIPKSEIWIWSLYYTKQLFNLGLCPHSEGLRDTLVNWAGENIEDSLNGFPEGYKSIDPEIGLIGGPISNSEKYTINVLAKELIKLLNDKTTLSALQQKSSIAAEEKYNWESEANKLFQFYRSLQ